MMGVADFPIEFLKLLKIAPKDDAPNDPSTFSYLIQNFWGFT